MVEGRVSDDRRHGPHPGEVFADRYRVERTLGVGGMGFVFAARAIATGELVAIKMLLPALAQDGEIVARFLREGRAARRIQSRHGIRIHEASALPDGTPYLVMELLEGIDLHAVLERDRRVRVADAVDWILQACEALAEAHAAKTVHRDLKPSNLFLATTPDGPCIKVLDFGISKSLAADGASLKMTRTSAVMGTPLYMSPEQLKSARDVDERSDIWSIGVILYELVSGRPPFDAESLPELSVLVLSKDAPPLVAADVPAGLAEVIATCLRKDRAARFANLADFADAIAPFGSQAARASATRIVATLGMPRERASVRSLPALAATMPLAPSFEPRASAPRTLGSFARQTSLAITKKHSFALAASAVALAVGLVLIALSLTARRMATVPPMPLVAAAPPPSATVRVDPVPPPPPEPIASVVATVAPSASASAPPRRAPPKPAAKPIATTKRPSAFDTEN